MTSDFFSTTGKLIYEEKMLGSYQSRAEGTVDISVQRDELGENVYRFEKAGDEITAAYENPSEEDIAWLKKDRLIG